MEVLELRRRIEQLATEVARLGGQYEQRQQELKSIRDELAVVGFDPAADLASQLARRREALAQAVLMIEDELRRLDISRNNSG